MAGHQMERQTGHEQCATDDPSCGAKAVCHHIAAPSGMIFTAVPYATTSFIV